ncbi:S8 family peptidase [Bradyrhizobium paxllaeri]|uniref:S8 family peptidase n=1 Tax=Bradyrhizobium paxllaeri TaxID=190148 RepID=UPI0008104F8A|nr:S8 family serine peptidase [Bradyrhizobium paxllaeri]
MQKYVLLRSGSDPGEYALTDASIEVADLSERNVAEAERDPTVREVAPVAPMELIDHCESFESFDDAPHHRGNWGISAVGAGTCDLSGAGVTVAIIDSGIVNDHPAFDPFKILERDFSGSGKGDRCGHGTHCAGILFGQSVGGTRIGIAPGIKRALIAKVRPDTGKIESDMVFEAMLWAMRERADIISMSLGFDYLGMVSKSEERGLPRDLALSDGLISYRKNLRMFDAIAALMRKQAALGCSPLIVAAAGNQSRRQCTPAVKIGVSLPAAASDMVSVAAAAREQDSLLRIASFSNILPTITAPGVGILSAWLGGGLRLSSGTSAACPHAAGVAALWLERLRRGDRKVDADRLRAMLRDTARRDNLSADYDPSDFGAGVVAAPTAG